MTKSQRHITYLIMLAEYEYKPNIFKGFCSLFLWISGIELDNDREFSNFKRMLPELYKKGNLKDDSHFFKDWNERIKALWEVIIETA